MGTECTAGGGVTYEGTCRRCSRADSRWSRHQHDAEESSWRRWVRHRKALNNLCAVPPQHVVGPHSALNWTRDELRAASLRRHKARGRRRRVVETADEYRGCAASGDGDGSVCATALFIDVAVSVSPAVLSSQVVGRGWMCCRPRACEAEQRTDGGLVEERWL